MNIRFAWKKIGVLLGAVLLVACAPAPSANHNRYQLTHAAKIKPMRAERPISLLVMQPTAVDGYDTDQMLYINQPYQLSAFANNSWMSPPVTMLLPLMVRSIESSRYFYAVTSDLNASKTDYRLESQLIYLQQNFLVKPSHLQIAIRVMLIHSADSHVVATRTIAEDIPCASDTPFGGVLAANQATQHLTSRITKFVIDTVQHDRV